MPILRATYSILLMQQHNTFQSSTNTVTTLNFESIDFLSSAVFDFDELRICGTGRDVEQRRALSSLDAIGTI